MRKKIGTFLLLASALNLMLLPVATYAQQQNTTPNSQDERVVVSSSEVVLDAVVKDKKGRPVRDLSAADFEVYEDGVRQQVQSFRLVSRERGGAPTSSSESTPTATTTTSSQPGKTPPTDSVGGVSAVALVFDRLAPDARNRSREAALAYLKDNLSPSQYVGVFLTELSLRVVQPYTTNVQTAREGVERATGTSGGLYTSTAEQVRSISQRQAGLQSSSSALEGTLSSGGAGGGGGAAATAAALGANQAEQTFNEMTRRSLETFEMLERDQQGYATTNGLLSIVNAMRRIPGRKAVLFFSEGIAIPPAVQGHFRAVISAANRANTTIYAVDAAGLRAESSLKESRDEINALAARRAEQANSTREYTGGPLTRQLERNEDLLRLNPQSGLGQLANETGGFLISETNNIAPRLRQVDEDLNTYYLLTYTPQNSNYDGRFRQISVKVNKSNTEVQARKGYYAINSSFASPVLPYEAQALAALSNPTRPDAFPFQVGGLNFPEADRPGFVTVLVDVPSSSITYASDATNKTFATNFAIVALIKNADKQVVRKVSNQYALSGGLDKLEAAKRSNVLFYRETDLPPGRYTIEAAVHDALTNKTSVRSSIVDVLATDETRLRLSNVMIIKRVEKYAAPAGGQNTAPKNPFVFGEVLAYPNLNEPVSISKNKQFAIFFTAYQPKGTTEAPKLTINFTQNGRSVGQTSSPLSAPDATGRIQYATAMPLDKFQPGVYDLTVTVTEGQQIAARTTRMVVDP